MFKIGVIGWGLRSPLAKMAHRPEEGVELVAAVDTRAEAREAFLDEYPGATAYSDLSELADPIDAAIVMSPDWLHEDHAVALLKKGVAVYLEKPMAITIESCDRILAAAQQTGTKLYIGHNLRHYGFVTAMKEWIDSGKIGNVKTAWCRHFVSYGGEAYYRDWHADRRLSAGLLLQKGSHDIDVLHYLCGGFSERVTAMGSLMVYGDLTDKHAEGEHVKVEFTNTWPPRSLTKVHPVVDVEDVSMMLMELDNGVLASYQQCMFAPDGWRNYTVIGDEGRIENFNDRPGEAVIKVWNKSRYGFSYEADEERVVPAVEGWHGGSDDAIISEFLAYVRDGVEPINQPIAARMAVAAGVCATESLRSGSVPVDVPPVRWIPQAAD